MGRGAERNLCCVVSGVGLTEAEAPAGEDCTECCALISAISCLIRASSATSSASREGDAALASMPVCSTRIKDAK